MSKYFIRDLIVFILFELTVCLIGFLIGYAVRNVITIDPRTFSVYKNEDIYTSCPKTDKAVITTFYFATEKSSYKCIK